MREIVNCARKQSSTSIGKNEAGKAVVEIERGMRTKRKVRRESRGLSKGERKRKEKQKRERNPREK
jgi:hypothetical protein